MDPSSSGLGFCCFPRVHVPSFRYVPRMLYASLNCIFKLSLKYASSPGRLAAEGDGLSPVSLQQFSLAAPDPLVVFTGGTADTAGHGCPSCNPRGQKRVPPSCAGGWKLFGGSAQWGGPVGQTRATNPRTGGQRPKDLRPPLLL